MYIEDQKRRARLADEPGEAQDLPELSHVIVKLILEFLPAQPSYDDYFGMIGMLRLVMAELERRAVAPFMEQRATLGGDVGFDDLPQNRGK